MESLEGRGIGFHSLTESIDTTTAGGKLTFHIFAALGEFERSMIRERTCAGLDAARARGRVGGRPPSLTDKDLEMAKTLLANPDITVEHVAARLGVAPATFTATCPAVVEPFMRWGNDVKARSYESWLNEDLDLQVGSD